MLPTERTVSCPCQDVTVRQALEILLRGTPLRYQEMDGQVVVALSGSMPASPRRGSPPRGAARPPALEDGVSPKLAQSLLQGASVAGTVVNSRGAPVVGARVTLLPAGQGAKLDTATNDAGRFRFDRVTATAASLQILMIGYRPFTQQVTVGDNNVRVVLVDAAVNLDELVVTGTPRAIERRAIGNSVAKIEASDVIALAPVPDVGSLIRGRAAGVLVLPGTGQVGTGPIIKIRGVKSFSLNTTPLVYIDGVRTDNGIGTGPSVQGSGGTINRLNDINPEDIESIEIIKGPAAATLYGTEASNGVIQVITKAGRPSDRPEYNLNVRHGANWFMNPAGRIARNWGIDPKTNQPYEQDLFAQEAALGNRIFRTGHLQSYGVSARGGTSTLRYYLSGDFDGNQGIEDSNHVSRAAGRANVSLKPNDRIDLNASLGFTRGRTTLACEGGCGGVMFAVVFADPTTRDRPQRGFFSAPPEAWEQTTQYFQEYDRTTVSLQFSHRPTSWLSHRLVVGEDRTHEDNESITPRMGAYLRQFFGGGFADGSKFLQRRDLTTNTVDYNASADLGLSKAIRSTTSVGAQYYRRFTRLAVATGRPFPAPNLDVVAATALTTGSDDYIKNATVGVFVQEQLSFRGRVFLTGAIRADDNSAFGSSFDFVKYPKVSATWVISEEPFWKTQVVSSLKLRGAFGASGQQPQDFAALQSHKPVTGGSGVAALTPQFIGNDSLKPERGEEIELGFEAGLFGDRIGIEASYYRTRTRDAILLRDLPPSLGFPGQQFVNAGRIDNTGLEAQIRAGVIQGRNTRLDLTLNLARNTNRVVDLGGLDLGKGYIQTGANQRHVVGFPVAGWWIPTVISATLDANNRAQNLQCDGGQSDGRAGGPPVSCDNLPRVYVGSPTPNFEGSLATTLTLRNRFRIYGLVDWKTGYKKYDNNLRPRCQAFLRCRENYFPREYDPARIAEMQSAAVFLGYAINDSKYAKLRELAVGYDVPDRWARWLGARRASINIAGRNLITWSPWTGLDPEAQLLGLGINNLEQDNTPQLAQFVATISVTF